MSKSPTQEQMIELLKYYQNGKLIEAERRAVALIEEFPRDNFSWRVLAAVLAAAGKKPEAVEANRTAVMLSPQDAEAYSNLSVTLAELGVLDEALVSYKRAIALKPDFAEAHNNMGNTLQELNRFNEAEESYKRAITLQPKYAEAHSNLGNALYELGRFDEAEESFEQALALQPYFANAQKNLVNLLTSHTSRKKSSQQIGKVDKEIKEINLNANSLGVISDDEIIHLFNKASNIIKKYGLDIGTDVTQAYRRNAVDLNCKRHKKIFDTSNVIPEHCFGCYKVQVEPRSLLELVKLFIVFNQIKLSANNTRKCMIEMRPEVAGFYKGLIYCSDLEEACQITDYLEMVIKEKIASGLPLAVKRGCSEYALAFPDYKEINQSGAQPMNYDKRWERIENEFDSRNSIKPRGKVPTTLSSLSLSDVLIIRNWIDYAKGIGDPSAQLLDQNGAKSHTIYSIAKSRLKPAQ